MKYLSGLSKVWVCLLVLLMVSCGGGGGSSGAADDSGSGAGSGSGDGTGSGDGAGSGSEPNDAALAVNCTALAAVNFDRYSGISGFSDATTDNKLGKSALQVAQPLATAAAIEVYQGADANVIFKINAMQESDGESTYALRVNGVLLGEQQNSRIHGTSIADYSLENHLMNNRFYALKAGDEIQVEFNNASNGLVVEGDSTATSRGRWHSLEICTDGDALVLEPEEPVTGSCTITGELNRFGRVELLCQGLAASEADASTFTDHRFNVTFTQGTKIYRVPGHFAADANAADSGAVAGDKWRAYFMPPTVGDWQYQVSFRSGSNIAVSTNDSAGTPVGALDGKSGNFSVGNIAATLPDMRARGLLTHQQGERYLRFSGDKTVFVQAGLDSPENIFGYSEFDNTSKYFTASSCKGLLHDFAPHESDWLPGDPTWNSGKGKSLIGLINYLSGRGVNSVYIMANTVQGDGCDAHPWVTYNQDGSEKTFDVSKLDQWERVLRFIEHKGMLIHLVTQETENDQLLNGGELGLERKLYYRELISRFAHHPALQWNLGEENSNTLAQQKSFADFFKQTDPYKHAVLMHTYPDEHNLYEGLLGYGAFDGPTLQFGNIPNSATNLNNVYETAKTWLQKSTEAGKPWVVTFTEASGANAPRPNTTVDKTQRVFWMWASAMSGGAGYEWYLKNDGAGHAYDLAVENLREFDQYWEQSGYFAKFFRDIVQRELGVELQDLISDNGLTSTDSDWVLADPGKAYIVFLRDGGTTNITLPDNKVYQILWFNPRTGVRHDGDLIQGPGQRPIGTAPNEMSEDWAVLITPSNETSLPWVGYEETDGLVVMEAENTTSPLGLWTKLTDISSYTGTGYLQFNGNEVELGPANSPLTYQFKVNTPGNYYLHVRAARETVDGRTDVANDGYIRLEGDYESGSRTPLNYLMTDSKYFGGNHMAFVWATGDRLDRDHEKWPVVYSLKAGEIYTFTLSGRSKLFKVDRIVFRHESVASNVAQALTNEETRN